MTNSPRLPILSLLLAAALIAVTVVTLNPDEPLPLSELQIGAVGAAVAFAVFGVQGLVSVALEGRELRLGSSPPHLADTLTAGIVIVSLLLVADAAALGYGIVVGNGTAWVGTTAAFGCLCLAVLLLFYKEAFLGDEACLDDREDGVPW